jgi:hypothetical protein
MVVARHFGGGVGCHKTRVPEGRLKRTLRGISDVPAGTSSS